VALAEIEYSALAEPAEIEHLELAEPAEIEQLELAEWEVFGHSALEVVEHLALDLE
jgi:hypothetical protein